MNHKAIVVNWKEFKTPIALPRMYDADLNTEFIITISGPRRAGKTFFCFQLMQKLAKEGISKENIFYVNFEDNKLLGANADDLDMLFEQFLEISENNKKQKLYFFFDEIQVVKDWDSWARKIHDQQKDIRLVLTGSSSKLLSREISTKLRGRVLNTEIFPLSFREILLWENIHYNIKTISSSREKTAVKKAFSKFLRDGGYPAVYMNKTLQRDQILQGYFDSMLFKDVIERYKIADVKKLKSLAQLLFQSTASEMSYNKLAGKMKAAGFDIGKSTIIKYISYFEDAYLFFQNLKYEYSTATQLGSIKKVYCIDNGILNSVSFKFSEDTGKLLENAAYIELKRRGETIYRHKANHDCDFLIVKKSKVVSAIQVTQKLDENNEERGVAGLIEALNTHNLSKGIILTENQEEEKTIEGKKIIIRPVWKWLLEND